MAALWAQSKLDIIGVGAPIEEGSWNGRFDDSYSWQLDVHQVDPTSVEPPPQAAAGGNTIANPGLQQRMTTSAGNAGAIQVSPFDIYQLDLTVFWGGRYGSSQKSAHFSTLRAMNPDPTTQQGGAPGMSARWRGVGSSDEKAGIRDSGFAMEERARHVHAQLLRSRIPNPESRLFSRLHAARGHALDRAARASARGHLGRDPHDGARDAFGRGCHRSHESPARRRRVHAPSGQPHPAARVRTGREHRHELSCSKASGDSMRFVAPMPGYLSKGGPYVQTLKFVGGRRRQGARVHRLRCSTASILPMRRRRWNRPCCSIRSRMASSNTAHSTIRAISPTGPISGTIPASRRSWCASRSRCVPRRASCFRTWRFRSCSTSARRTRWAVRVRC